MRFNELWKLIKRQPKVSRQNFIKLLTSAKDTLTWAEQARELLWLSSPAYVFDSADAWHEKGHCWVGQNLDSGKLVFLYPAQATLSQTELKHFIDYSKMVAAQKKTELIILSKDNIAISLTGSYRRTIRVERESALLNNLVDFRHYTNDIRKRVLANKLPDSSQPRAMAGVPSPFYPPHSEEINENIEQYLRKWLLEPGQRQLALLGKYNQGKNTTAEMLTYQLLQEGAPTRIPILIKLRGKSPRNLTPLELLGTWSAPYRIEPQALMRLLIAGRLLLIFEGFDEMALVGDAEIRLKHFQALWQLSYPQAKLLFTGQPNLFLDDEKIKTVLGISKPVGDNKAYIEVIRFAAEPSGNQRSISSKSSLQEKGKQNEPENPKRKLPCK